MFYFLALSLCLGPVMGLTTIRSRLGDNDQSISNPSIHKFSELCVESYGEMKSAGKARHQSRIAEISETESVVKLIVQMDVLNCSEDQRNFIPNQCTVDKAGPCYCILNVANQSAEVEYIFCPALHSHGKIEFSVAIDISYHTMYELTTRSCKMFNDNYRQRRIEYGTYSKIVKAKINFNFSVIAVNMTTHDTSKENSNEHGRKSIFISPCKWKEKCSLWSWMFSAIGQKSFRCVQQWLHQRSVSVTFSHPVDHGYEQQWQKFKMTHNRRFESEHEELMRKNIFEKNSRMIDLHNMQYERGLQSYTMKLNQFVDWTEEELSQLRGAKVSPNLQTNKANSFLRPLNIDELPEKIDWRDHNLVTSVENQGTCRSCYAFSAVGALEGQMARKTGKLVRLSKQNIVDCSSGPGRYNQGCNGGFMNETYDYILKNDGLDTEESYPYDVGVSLFKERRCRFKKDSVGARIKGYVQLEQSNEQQLLEAVATVGPISVAIDVLPKSFVFYRSGVYQEPLCTKYVNHAVLIVGYGTEDGLDYWLIKNSYGIEIQDHGYIKIIRNENHCGVAEAGIYPIV